MKRSAVDAVAALVRGVPTGSGGLAAAAVCGDVIELRVVPGADALAEDSLFQFGSITKTFTGLALATCVVGHETSLDTTVGSILGSDAGAAADVTLLALATHRSGLSRLPPNLDLARVSHLNPYASFGESELLAALRLMPTPTPGRYEYSNFGFMLLGYLLSRITGVKYEELVARRIFEALQMKSALCGVPENGGLPGYDRASQVPWWTTSLPGAGGTAGSIRDLASYAAAHVSPPSGLRAPIEMATRRHATGQSVTGLGWVYEGDVCWHNGATGGFRAFVAFHSPTACAVALLANSHGAEDLNRLGFRGLDDLVRGRL